MAEDKSQQKPKYRLPSIREGEWQVVDSRQEKPIRDERPIYRLPAIRAGEWQKVNDREKIPIKPRRPARRKRTTR